MSVSPSETHCSSPATLVVLDFFLYLLFFVCPSLCLYLYYIHSLLPYYYLDSISDFVLFSLKHFLFCRANHVCYII